MKSICLCMILKNEGHIIERCLNSVKNIIDTYVICDTGSTDDTKDKIKNFFDKCGIKGIIYDHQWVNFGVNRNMLLQAAKNKADYLLLVDADYVINVHDKNFKQNLDKASYLIKWEGDLDYRNIKLIRSDLEWKYFCPTHEYLRCLNENENPTSFNISTNVISITEYCDGGCRDNKFKRDIDLLLNEININPNDPDISRYYFYLARSYEDLKDYENALIYYEKRANIEGFAEEIYFAKYKCGICKIMLKYSFEDISETLSNAYNYRPTRLEAIYSLVTYCTDNKFYNAGYLFGKNASKTLYPINDILFIEKSIHTYLFKINYGICAYYAGKYDDAIFVFMELLLLCNDIPNDTKYIVIRNILFCLSKIANYKYDVDVICNELFEIYKNNQYQDKNIKYINEILIFCRNSKLFDICYYFGIKLLNENQTNEDIIKIKDEMGICAYYLGKYQESIDLCNDILILDINGVHKNRMQVHIDFSMTKLNQISYNPL